MPRSYLGLRVQNKAIGRFILYSSRACWSWSHNRRAHPSHLPIRSPRHTPRRKGFVPLKSRSQTHLRPWSTWIPALTDWTA